MFVPVLRGGSEKTACVPYSTKRDVLFREIDADSSSFELMPDGPAALLTNLQIFCYSDLPNFSQDERYFQSLFS